MTSTSKCASLHDIGIHGMRRAALTVDQDERTYFRSSGSSASGTFR